MTNLDVRPAAQAAHKSKMDDARKVLLSADDLYERGIRYSRSQRHKLIQIGAFPRPVKLSKQRNAWLTDEIEAWIEARASERAA